jgi:DnaJ-class molecular chaperone
MDDIQEPGALTGLRCPVCDGRGWRGFHSLGRVETAQCVACGGTGVARLEPHIEANGTSTAAATAQPAIAGAA